MEKINRMMNIVRYDLRSSSIAHCLHIAALNDINETSGLTLGRCVVVLLASWRKITLMARNVMCDSGKQSDTMI